MITVELAKLFKRPRMYVIVALLCLLPFIVAIFLATTRIPPPPGQGGAFLSAVLSNGALYPAAALALVLPVFLPVAVAVLAGDSIAGEATGGTLRYLLIRPVGRTRLLVAKLIAQVAFVLFAIAAVVVTSYLTGVLMLGTGESTTGGVVLLPPDVTSLSGDLISPGELALRLLGTIGYITISMLGVAAIALFLSTLTDSALGAAMGALATLVTSQVLVTLDAAESVKPYLPTRYWLAWIDFFRDPILWRDIERGAGLQFVYVAVLLGAAWANFKTKDIGS
ncbi:ABC transporter permease [Virgisporangium aliadipatigenens]|uniref:ABC transporter permease n=1 Tax=Virgisporangium aliadipatigenens TaxID=741659 RepID=A0A8J3YE18_9ACTN|nr:ABC transporter permease [Virgisporangium aliadipatigenens]GIJ43276.1 ABC transporter permease [Virgisporangium aliadipatigenens]